MARWHFDGMQFRQSIAAVWSRWPLASVITVLVCSLSFVSGCASGRRTIATATVRRPAQVPAEQSTVSLVAYQNGQNEVGSNSTTERDNENGETITADLAIAVDSLPELETLAQSQNPALRGLQQEVDAAYAKARYIGKLPDPTIGANVFAHPIETASGSQRANLTVMQMIPWLSRLDAQAQQTFLEALAVEQILAGERLKVIGDVRALWFRLYVLGKQIETNRANQQLLKTLIDTANARVSTGNASQGDVLLGTLELSKLAEQLLAFEQRVVSTKAELNRLAGRDANHPISIPSHLEVSLPDWSHEMLRQLAWEQQPAIAAAELRTQATRWGIEVAKLKRRPDVSFNASWFAIDDNRPTTNIVEVGRDAWSIGAQLSVPLWHRKYDDIEQEAVWKHAASHASVDDVMQRYDSLLRDLWEQARTADETGKLYKQTILPQARQTLNADVKSYSNGNVEFDRVVRDFRNVLTLELGYHRSLGQLAAVLARIRQAVGTDLAIPQLEASQLPPPAEP